jgi:ubiquinone/menaquinone biosynthesis C-methylase UbiE
VGEAFVRSLIDQAGLQPDDAVLDAGCGAGRMAVPLTRYLSPRGNYEGFDAWPAGVRWCQEQITPRFGNFRFCLARVHNGLYARDVRSSAAEFRFPYDDHSFDVVFMSSVLTHLLPDDMENYLAETARVLKPGGRCLLTWFLLTPEVLARVEAGQTKPEFLIDYGDYRAENEEIREGAIAYDLEHVRRLYERFGLHVVGEIEAGAWSGVLNPVNFQDMILARKASCRGVGSQTEPGTMRRLAG